MKILKDPKFQFYFLLLLFFVINVLQSHNTYLFEDEAYYYVWSQKLAFGYFDHPPMVAFWAAIGNFFLEGELGLRLMSTIGFSLMLWMIWQTINHKKKWEHVLLFFIVIVSLTLWQVFGFIMTPDTPLLFFTALFLLAYRRFLQNESTFNTLLLGLGMSAMLYSKYHGILVIGFVVISHLTLLKNPRFWMAGIFGLLLFLPHLYWQYQNGFPSIEYHLKERGKKPYSILNNLTHLVNMVAIIGITFPVIYKAFYKHKVVSVFERSLKFIVYGFFVFFFISSFKSEPQAQWLIVVLIPITLIVFPYFVDNKGAYRWLKILAFIQLAIILVLRIFLASPSLSPVELEPHISQQWIPDLKKNTDGKPVVFVNSYRNASLYNFYTGIETHSYSILKGRQSQYNLLDYEDKMQGENIFAASSHLKKHPKLAKRYSTYIHGELISDYQTFEKVKCVFEAKELALVQGINEFTFTFENTYDREISFEHVHFYGVFQGYKNKILAKVPLQISEKGLNANEKKTIIAKFKVTEMEEYEETTFRVALEFYDLLEGYQGNKTKIIKAK